MSTFSTPPPSFSTEEASDMVFELYDLAANAIPLTSERDQNFICSTHDSQKLVLKISNPGEDRGVLEMQNVCMKYIHDHDATLQVPYVITSNEATDIIEYTKGSTTYLVRLVSYLPGILLNDISHNLSVLYDWGSFLGRLCVAMSGFDHSAANREFQWDISNIDFIKCHKHHISDSEDVVDHFLGLYEQNVCPNATNLRRAVIHNDGHGHNILVSNDGDICGIIDFGDVVKSFVACEPAVGMASVALEKEEPLESIAQVLKGFHEKFPLTTDELLSVIFLVCIRSCITVTMAAYRKKLFPENEYISVSEEKAWHFLKKMRTEDLHEWGQALLNYAE